MLYTRLSNSVLYSAFSYEGRADALAKNNTLFKIYNDVEGIGEEGGMSDAKLQRLKGTADQIAITIAITAFS